MKDVSKIFDRHHKYLTKQKKKNLETVFQNYVQDVSTLLTEFHNRRKMECKRQSNGLQINTKGSLEEENIPNNTKNKR